MVNFLLKLFYSSLIFNHDINGIFSASKRFVSVQGINGKFAMNEFSHEQTLEINNDA